MKVLAGWAVGAGHLVLVLLSGCGRTEHDDAKVVDNVPQAGSPAAPPPGVGPIDVAAQPADLPMACADREETLALELPCLVGSNLAGNPSAAGFHAVECKLAGDPSGVAIAFTLPLSTLPEHLGEPLLFPMDGASALPSLGTIIGAERFAGTLTGVVTFTQVDLDSRAFVASLEDGKIDWAGDAGSSFSCSTLDGPLWAVAGNFL